MDAGGSPAGQGPCACSGRQDDGIPRDAGAVVQQGASPVEPDDPSAEDELDPAFLVGAVVTQGKSRRLAGSREELL